MKVRHCPNCKAGMKIGIAANAKGSPIHPWYCDACDKAWGSMPASKADAETWANVFGPLKRVLTCTEKALRNGRISHENLPHMIPCEVCGDTGTTEIHHWAPFHLFGCEADKWPVSRLCAPCHRKWHAIVTPNMSKQKGKAA